MASVAIPCIGYGIDAGNVNVEDRAIARGDARMLLILQHT